MLHYSFILTTGTDFNRRWSSLKISWGLGSAEGSRAVVEFRVACIQWSVVYLPRAASVNGSESLFRNRESDTWEAFITIETVRCEPKPIETHREEEEKSERLDSREVPVLEGRNRRGFVYPKSIWSGSQHSSQHCSRFRAELSLTRSVPVFFGIFFFRLLLSSFDCCFSGDGFMHGRFCFSIFTLPTFELEVFMLPSRDSCSTARNTITMTP